MAQFFKIYLENPQLRLLNNAIDIINAGGVIAYPTDSGYALGCKLGNKKGMEKILDIRKISLQHHLTLVCSNLAEIGKYAKLDNRAFKLIKSCTPGGYTFILEATKIVPSITLHPKRKTIGIRIPDNNIVLSLLDLFNEPLLSSSLILPNEESVLTNADDIAQHIGKRIDLIIDGGVCIDKPTTVIDLTSGIKLVRKGSADISIFNFDEE